MQNSGFEDNELISQSNGMISLIPLQGCGNSSRNCYKTRIFGKWIFIKSLNPGLESDSRYIEAFRKEQEIGLQLDHPNLPKYVFVPDLLPGRAFVAMEYIDGTTLWNCLFVIIGFMAAFFFMRKDEVPVDGYNKAEAIREERLSIEDARIVPPGGGAAIPAPVEQTLTRISPAPEQTLNRAKPDKENVDVLLHKK